MNKIFKVIYSKTRHCYVVVSELAKSHCKSTTGKASGEHRTGRRLTAMVLAALIGVTLGIATPGTSFARDGEENQEPGTHATVVGGKGNSAWGTDATIAGGSDNNTGAFGAVVVGGHKNVASTYNANTTDENFYIENSTVVGGESNISLGGYSTLVGGTSGVVRGLYSTGIAGGSTDRYARYALAAGYGAVVTNSGVNKVVTTKDTPSGARTYIDYNQVSTALGFQATANQPGTISFGHDAGDVSGYTVEWVQDKPDALGVYHHSNGDDHNLYDEPPLIKETKYDTAYYNRLVKIANGINSHDAVTMGQMATADNTKANVAADNIGSKLQVVKKDDSGNVVTDSTTGLPVMVAASDEEKTANESAWGQALGTGAIAEDNDQLVTGNTVYNAMLTKANIDMDNISDGGKTVIRNLAKDAVKVVDGSHTYVTSKEDGNATAYSVNIKTGQVASGVSDLVTGGTVYDAIQSAKISGTGGADFDLTGKAEVGAGNVGANLSKFSSDNLTDQQKLAEKTTNENDWGTALGTGKIASADGDTSVTDNNGSKQLVKGDTVYKEVRPEDGKYVKTAQTTAKNLKELDSAIQQQAKELTNSLSVKAGWGINKTDDNTISVKHNLSSGDNAYADTDATGLVLGGFVKDGDASKQYGATAETSVIVGGQNALASGVCSVVTGGMDNVASGRNSTVVGGDANNAAGNRSAVLGGRDNTAGGIASVAGGGIMNVANGQQSVALGGAYNYALGTNSTAIGGMGGNGMYGYNTSVNGSYSVSLAGGSTGADALNGLAAGNQSVVTTANGTAVGYQATTDESGTISFGHDAGDVSGYTVTWKQRTDGKTNADLTTNDYTQAPESVTATTYTDSYYNRLVKVAEGQDDHDVVVVKQLKQYAQKDAGNIGSNIKVYTTDGDGHSVEDTDASTAAQKANENLWGTAIGTGKIADSKATNAADNGSQQLVTGGTVYSETHADSTKNYNYITAGASAGSNLAALDEHVGTNAANIAKNTTSITNLQNGNGFTTQGDTYIKNLAKGSVKVVDGTNTTVTNGTDAVTGADTYAVNVSADAIKGAVATDLAGKADINASNISGDNLTAWQSKLGSGSVVAGDTGLVTGGAVYSETHADSTKNYNYITAGASAGSNLAALDEHVGTNAANIAKNTTSITNLQNGNGFTTQGDTYIKNLAKGSVKVVDGTNTTVTNGTDAVTGADTYAVNVSADAIKGAVATDLAGKADINASNISGDNLTAWQSKLGSGSVVAGDTGLVTGGAVYSETHADSTKNYNYITAGASAGSNLAALDERVGINAGNITDINKTIQNLGGTYADRNLSNLTNDGKTVIGKAAVGAVTVEAGDRVEVKIDKAEDGSSIQYTVSAKNDGKVSEKDENLVSGATVYNYIKGITDQNTTNLAGKANIDASNIGTNLKNADGSAASADEITKNKEAWASAIGTDKVAKGNKQLVTSDAVATALEQKADQSYVDDQLKTKADKSYVDNQLKTKADANNVYTKSEVDDKMKNGLDGKAGKDLNNIDENGKKVIKDLAKSSIKVIGDKNTTVTEGMDGDAKTYTVKVEGNGAVESGNTGLISGDTLYKEVHVDKDGSYIKSGNTVGQNLSSLDTGLKTTSDLIHTNDKGDTIQIGGSSTATKIDVSGKDGKGNTTGRVITGVVSDTNDPNSAANVGYVNGLTAANTQQIYRDMNNAYSRLDTNINRAAAGSNALAALHPLDFDPADKASFAVGYGHYHNANAAAVGAFYQPNANTMVNMGISLGNGDPGFNAGVSFKIGKGSTYNGVSKAEMAQTIHDQAAEISTIKANDAAKDKRIDALEKENQEMKKQIQEILARLNG